MFTEKTKLSSPRLSLVPFTETDAAIFHELNTDPFIRKFLWDDEIISFGMAEEIIAENRSLFEENGYGLWKILLKDNGSLIGYTGLWFFFDEPQPQLIYALLSPYTGQGYATEASKQIIEYAFSKLAFKYLVAATDEPHTASQKVALRLGMRHTEKRMENDKSTLFFRIDAPKTSLKS